MPGSAGSASQTLPNCRTRNASSQALSHGSLMSQRNSPRNNWQKQQLQIEPPSPDPRNKQLKVPWELQWTQDFLPEHHFCHGPFCKLTPRAALPRQALQTTKCRFPAGRNKPGVFWMQAEAVKTARFICGVELADPLLN